MPPVMEMAPTAACTALGCDVIVRKWLAIVGEGAAACIMATTALSESIRSVRILKFSPMPMPLASMRPWTARLLAANDSILPSMPEKAFPPDSNSAAC